MQNLKHKSGLTLVESLVAIVLIFGAFSAAISLIEQSNKIAKNLEIVTSIGMIRTNLYNIIASDIAWHATVQNPANSNFSCLQVVAPYPANNCANGPGNSGSFAFYEADGTLYYDPNASPNNGFDLKGVPCNSFDAVNGNLNCPFRVTTNWSPICPVGSCSGGTTLINVQVDFHVSLPTTVKYPINENRFNFSVVRNRL